MNVIIKEKRKMEKKTKYKVMAFNSKGDLIDHYEDCKVFVVTEDSVPARVMSEGVYTLLIDNSFEIGDYVIGACNSNKDIVATAINKGSYDINKHEIIGKIVGKDINVARVMI